MRFQQVQTQERINQIEQDQIEYQLQEDRNNFYPSRKIVIAAAAHLRKQK